MDAEAGLTYDIFERRRELAIEGFTYPSELLPVNPVDSMPEQFARAAAELGQHPLKDAEDYENWLLRIDGYVRWTKQAIANMREGMRRGYTSPRVLMERTLPVLQGFGEDTPANVFYLPLRTMPDTIKEPERTRLAASLNSAVKDKLLPAYRELHDFIRSEYLPRARTSVALSVLPLGPSWYAYRLKLATDTQLTANEIHKIGLGGSRTHSSAAVGIACRTNPGAGPSPRAARKPKFRGEPESRHEPELRHRHERRRECRRRRECGRRRECRRRHGSWCERRRTIERDPRIENANPFSHVLAFLRRPAGGFRDSCACFREPGSRAPDLPARRAGWEDARHPLCKYCSECRGARECADC